LDTGVSSGLTLQTSMQLSLLMARAELPF